MPGIVDQHRSLRSPPESIEPNLQQQTSSDMEPEDLSLHHLVSGARTVTGRLADEEDTLDQSPLDAQRITLQIEKELLQAEKAFIVSRKQSKDEGGAGGGGGRGDDDDEGGEGSSGSVVADRTKVDIPGDGGSIGGDVPENGRPSARERETNSSTTAGTADGLGSTVNVSPLTTTQDASPSSVATTTPQTVDEKTSEDSTPFPASATGEPSS